MSLSDLCGFLMAWGFLPDFGSDWFCSGFFCCLVIISQLQIYSNCTVCEVLTCL